MAETCAHEQEFMSVAVYGGWQTVPMRCFTCMAEWQEAGRCFECGAESAHEHEVGSELLDGQSTPIMMRFCRKCWREMNRAEVGHCATCGRWTRMDHDSYVEVEETPGYYDPYFGPQPPEPNFETRCPRHRPNQEPEE